MVCNYYIRSPSFVLEVSLQLFFEAKVHAQFVFKVFRFVIVLWLYQLFTMMYQYTSEEFSGEIPSLVESYDNYEISPMMDFNEDELQVLQDNLVSNNNKNTYSK